MLVKSQTVVAASERGLMYQQLTFLVFKSWRGNSNNDNDVCDTYILRWSMIRTWPFNYGFYLQDLIIMIFTVYFFECDAINSNQILPRSKAGLRKFSVEMGTIFPLFGSEPTLLLLYSTIVQNRFLKKTGSTLQNNTYILCSKFQNY